MDERAQYRAERKDLYDILKDVLLLPPRIFLSRPFLRAYLTLFLFSVVASILLLISASTYLLFYNAYIPHPGFEKQVYLQFSGDATGHPHPWGFASLAPSSGQGLHSNQPYDVEVTLHMPRSRANRAAGNFMLDLQLLGPEDEIAQPPNDTIGNLLNTILPPPQHQRPVIASERRPALLPYRSLPVEIGRRAFALPLYITGLAEEAETLVLPMLENAQFERGWRNIPQGIRIRIESRNEVQVYWVKVRFHAKLVGLRYLMRTYRLGCFAVFTLVFWSMSMGFAISVWGCAALLFRGRGRSKAGSGPAITGGDAKDMTAVVKTELSLGRLIKKEEASDDDEIDNLSDTSRSFPTFSRQPPLRYTASRIKQEEEVDALATWHQPPVTPTAGEEAQDEDENSEEADDFVVESDIRLQSQTSRDASRLWTGETDSGIGTSLDSGSGGGGSSSSRRRKGGNLWSEGDG